MCGISGGNFSDEKLLFKMVNSLSHRGPDTMGFYVNKEISFGQSRLSIIDISAAGEQPMGYSKKDGASNASHNKNHFKNAEYILTYNGEIYNYVELKDELKKEGFAFSTNSDSEVILASYACWGVDCLKKFNGMWAFTIFDKKKNIFFCSVDRLGQKPFYYLHEKKQFVFASELKALINYDASIVKKKNISKEAVDLYFSLGYVPSPFTIFKNVSKLEPSQYLIFDVKKNIIQTKKYFEIEDYKPIYDKKLLVKKGRSILEDAVKIRMRSDVPVGAFLSGGLDSTTIVSFMKKNTDKTKLHTFSISFPKPLDETKYINIAKNAFNTIHHNYFFSQKDIKEALALHQKFFDEPFYDYSSLATLKVSQLAKKKVTVCLSGDGGDEIFGGYNSHIMGKRLDMLYKLPKWVRKCIASLPVKKSLNSFVSLYLLTQAAKLTLDDKKNILSNMLSDDIYRSTFYKSYISKKFSYALSKSNNISEAFRVHDLLFNTLSNNFLVKVDRSSMVYGLEVRSPFLDYRFVNYSQSIPNKYKVSLFNSKILMRKIIKPYIPKSILHRGKQGFEPPLRKWLLENKEAKNYLGKSLNYLKETHKEWFDFYNSTILKRKDTFYQLYHIRLYLFGLWYEYWVKE